MVKIQQINVLGEGQDNEYIKMGKVMNDDYNV